MENYQKEYQAKNKERIKAQRGVYYSTHKEQNAERVKLFRKKQRDERDRILLLPSTDVLKLNPKERYRRMRLIEYNFLKQRYLRGIGVINRKYANKEKREQEKIILAEKLGYTPEL